MMRRAVVGMLALALLALVAACAPQVNPDDATTVPPDEEQALLPVVPGEGESEGYPGPETTAPQTATPAPEGYPPPAEPVEMPTGYPGVTVVAPSGQVDMGSLTPVTPENTTPQVMPAPGRPNATLEPAMVTLIEAIVGDLSQQLDIPRDEIELVGFEPTTWPNAGLGCPAPGMAYAEVLVEGATVTLSANGELYTYHIGGANSFVLCQDGNPVSTGVVPGP